jgi:hypothetical protein
MLRYRLAKRKDLETCQTLLPPGLQLEPAIRKRLAGLWTDLWAIGAHRFVVIEDQSRPYPVGIEAFGCSAFVTDAFAREFFAAPRPYLPAVVYARMLKGPSPVLTMPEIRAANASTGLNLVILHFGLRNPDMSDARTERALQAGSAAFYFCHAGYRLNILLNEVYGSQHADYMRDGGFRLHSAFDDGSAPQLAAIPAERRPYLFALRKEWVAPGAVNPLSFLFHAPAPELGFSPSEQSVLLGALMNESDVEIAATAGVSLDAIKKTWCRAYDRVAAAAPHLLGLAAPLERTTRGPEKRRYLLEYLRDHLEELRPFKCERG